MQYVLDCQEANKVEGCHSHSMLRRLMHGKPEFTGWKCSGRDKVQRTMLGSRGEGSDTSEITGLGFRGALPMQVIALVLVACTAQSCFQLVA